MSNTCSLCGNPLTPQQKKDKIKPTKVKHMVNGVLIESNVIPYDTSFYEIVTGKYKGNLVHRWNIVGGHRSVLYFIFFL